MEETLDKELDDLLTSITKAHYEASGRKVDKNFLIYNPVEFVKMSFPEKKIAEKRWTRSYGGYSLSINQLEEKRSVPYGLSAREIFEYFYNNFVDRENRNDITAHLFSFSSISDFVKKTKHLPPNAKISADQRLSALQMLLNIESSTIRVVGNSDERQTVTNNPIFRSYCGPANEKLADSPQVTTGGEILIELDQETFRRLARSRRIPTRAYLVSETGSNVTARDLCIYIGHQSYRLKKASLPFVDVCSDELRKILGKEDSYEKKYFNRDLKAAIKLLQEKFEELNPCANYPAEVIAHGRDNVSLRINNNSSIPLLLCS